MNNWLRRILGMAGMCLAWAAGWAITGLLIGIASLLLPFLPWAAFFKVFDAPLPALGLPGFIGGAIFSLLIGLAERRQDFEALSLARFSGWGAAAGLLLSLVPAAMVSVGLATLNRPGDMWYLTAIIIGPLTLMGAVSGAGSLLLARAARPCRNLLARLLENDQIKGG